MQRRNQLERLSMSSSPVSFQRMPRGTMAIVYQGIAEALATLASRESRCLPDGPLHSHSLPYWQVPWYNTRPSPCSCSNDLSCSSGFVPLILSHSARGGRGREATAEALSTS